MVKTRAQLKKESESKTNPTKIPTLIPPAKNDANGDKIEADSQEDVASGGSAENRDTPNSGEGVVSKSIDRRTDQSGEKSTETKDSSEHISQRLPKLVEECDVDFIHDFLRVSKTHNISFDNRDLRRGNSKSE